jgi:hypothetical protein
MTFRSTAILLAACVTTACPAHADEASTARFVPHWWFEGGLGAAQLGTGQAAPNGGDRSGWVFTLGAGYRLTPEWGVGVDLGSTQVQSFFVCGYYQTCTETPSEAARGKEFDHYLLTTQYRPAGAANGWIFGAGVGALQYCYGLQDGYSCQTVTSLGAGLTVGYDWRMRRAGRVGFRLAGESANFGARASESIAAFHYSAVRLTVNWSTN